MIMKKNYILSFFIFFVTFSVHAQDCDNPNVIIQDDIESYTPGDATGQAPHWGAWPGGAVGGTVNSEQASSGTQSIKIDGAAGTQDVLYLLGDPTSSHFIVSMNMYIPSGNNAYFNLQHEMPTTSAGFWAFDVFFNDPGTGMVDLNTGTTFEFTFDQDEWFEIYIIADIDSDEARIVIGTTTVGAWNFSNGITNGGADYPSSGLNSINFYPIDATHSYYIDDVSLMEISAAATNQYCYTATDITPGTHTVADLECFGAMHDIGANFANSGAWYSYTPADDGVISIASCGGGADTRGWIFEGECHDLKIVGVNDDQCDLGNGSQWASYREAVVTGGTTYFIMWDNPWDNAGFDFELTYSSEDPTPGHFCQSAIPVIPGEQNFLETFDGNAAVAGPNIGAYSSSSTPYSKSNWYKYTPAFDGTITISSCDGGVSDTRVWVYTGDCSNFDVLELEATDDDGCPADASSLLEDFAVTGGTTYYIEWDDRWDDAPFVWILEYNVVGYEVTFNVNMSEETVDPGGAHIAGEMNGWSGQPMTDNGDGTWSITFTLPEGETVEYKFQNGLDGWEDAIPADCTLGGFGNRYVDVGNANVNLDLVCFNACTDCTISTNDPKFSNAVSIYPNPVSEVLYLQMEFPEAVQNLQIRIMNTVGQRIIVENLGTRLSETLEIGIKDLPKGTYFLQLTNDEVSTMKKFVVQ
jgi:hypothetical protein